MNYPPAKTRPTVSRETLTETQFCDILQNLIHGWYDEDSMVDVPHFPGLSLSFERWDRSYQGSMEEPPEMLYDFSARLITADGDIIAEWGGTDEEWHDDGEHMGEVLAFLQEQYRD
jgi:hypothetical protein